MERRPAPVDRGTLVRGGARPHARGRRRGPVVSRCSSAWRERWRRWVGSKRVRAALVDALALVPLDAHAQRVRLMSRCAELEQVLGRHSDADRRLQQALAELPDPASVEAAELKVELSLAARFAGDAVGMHASAEEARQAAASVGAWPLEAKAAALVAFAAAESDRAELAVEHRSSIGRRTRRRADRRRACRTHQSALFLGWAEIFLGRFDDADRHCGAGSTGPEPRDKANTS